MNIEKPPRNPDFFRPISSPESEMERRHSDKELSDHYPLTREEIAELLQKARQAAREGDPITNDILARMTQGIPGITDPHPASGEVAEKILNLAEAFLQEMMKDYHDGGNDPGADRLYKIMTGPAGVMTSDFEKESLVKRKRELESELLTIKAITDKNPNPLFDEMRERKERQLKKINKRLELDN